MTDRRSQHVVNESELEWTEVRSPSGHAVIQRKRLAWEAGNRELGCSLTRIPPGKAFWPEHWHAANEEALYVLGGVGRLRLVGEDVRLVLGDYVAMLAGPQGLHALANDGSEDLVVLFISTMREPDVSVYGRTQKIGVFAGAAPGGDASKRTISKFLRADAEADYWEGEE